MFVPKDYTPVPDQFQPVSEVFLKEDHICLHHHLSKELFGDSRRANWIYYPERDVLLMSSAQSGLLSKLHKTSQQMLKERSANGSLAFYVLEVLLDHDLSRTNRDLSFERLPKLMAISVKLKTT